MNTFKSNGFRLAGVCLAVAALGASCGGESDSETKTGTGAMGGAGGSGGSGTGGSTGGTGGSTGGTGGSTGGTGGGTGGSTGGTGGTGGGTGGSTGGSGGSTGGTGGATGGTGGATGGTGGATGGTGGATGGTAGAGGSTGGSGGAGGSGMPDGGGGCPSYTTFTLGIHIVLDVHWDAATATLAGDDKVHLWNKAVLNANGTMLSGQAMSCGTQLPDINLNAVGEIAAGGKKVLIEIPFASWDAPSVPKFQQTGTLAGWAVGSDIVMEPTVALVGLTMPDPMAAWPDRKSIMGSDAEGDGKLGITGIPRMGNGYVYPPTALTALLGSADKVYIASRTVVQLTGKTTSCDEQAGTANAKFFDNHIIGCHVFNKAECDDGQVDFIDTSRTVYQPKGGTFKSKKLPDNATCADVRAALP